MFLLQSLGIATPNLGYKYNLPEYTETEVIGESYCLLHYIIKLS